MTSPVGEHGLEPEHLVAGHAVLHRAHAAGVGRDVAAEAGAVLAGEHRVDEAVRGGDLVELVERDARLHDRDVVLVSISRIPFMRSNDTTMPSARGTAAPDRPVPLPRAVTGHAVLVRDAQHAGDLGGGRRDARRTPASPAPR